VILGFAGVDLMGDLLGITPRLPPQWSSLSFCIRWKRRGLAITIAGNTVRAALMEGDAIDIRIVGVARALVPGATLEVAL
jgi:trehalose/maltose hydrolase-like predicted phosphorylase